jgi:hypothetical protein
VAGGRGLVTEWSFGYLQFVTMLIRFRQERSSKAWQMLPYVRRHHVPSLDSDLQSRHPSIRSCHGFLPAVGLAVVTPMLPRASLSLFHPNLSFAQGLHSRSASQGRSHTHSRHTASRPLSASRALQISPSQFSVNPGCMYNVYRFMQAPTCICL